MAWAQVVSGSTLDDEIKSILPRLKTVATILRKPPAKPLMNSNYWLFALGSFLRMTNQQTCSSWKKCNWLSRAVGRSAYRCQREGGSAFTVAKTAVGELENLIRGEIRILKTMKQSRSNGVRYVTDHYSCVA